MIKIPGENYPCFCGKIFQLSDQTSLKNHVVNCKEYHKNSPFSEIFFGSDLTKLNFGELMTLQYEFELYMKVIEEELNTKKSFKRSESPEHLIPLKKGISLSYENTNEIKLKKFSSIYHNFDEEHHSRGMVSESLFKCLKCKKFFFDDGPKIRIILQSCKHQFCKACILKSIHQNFISNNGVVKCLAEDCHFTLEENDYRFVLGEEKFLKLNEEMLEKMLNIISCVKCKEKFEFIRGKPDPLLKDSLGKPLSLTLALNFAENRFICPKCKLEQCKSCKSFPFHLGFNCENWKAKQISKLCIFCETPLIEDFDKDGNIIENPVCNSPECKEKLLKCCAKKQECGHVCKGYLNEAFCLPCFSGECAEKHALQLMDQKGSDYCNICFIEALEAAPCIQVSCGHIFHFDCLKKRLELRWSKPRISFSFCLCPLCKIWMSFPKDSILSEFMQENEKKYELLKNKCFERLKYEGRDKEERLFKPNDYFFQKPIDYAIAIYSYYECFKCKIPYFGGLKHCEDMLENRGNDKEYKPADLICPKCCEIPIDNCAVHGNDYIEFKCTYCCSLAQWFCWGTTHFCEPCHERINNGDDLTQYPKEKLPKCPGKEECPLRLDHKPNGEECSLGCSLCRNFKEESKDF